jgi:hypothetical protein
LLSPFLPLTETEIASVSESKPRTGSGYLLQALAKHHHHGRSRQQDGSVVRAGQAPRAVRLRRGVGDLRLHGDPPHRPRQGKGAFRQKKSQKTEPSGRNWERASFGSTLRSLSLFLSHDRRLLVSFLASGGRGFVLLLVVSRQCGGG